MTFKRELWENKSLHIANALLVFAMLIFQSCNDIPQDGDYYYNPADKSIGKIIEGSIQTDGTFAMEPLIYPMVDSYEDYDDYIVAHQLPDIDVRYERTPSEVELMGKQHKHYNDSVNRLISEIRKLDSCYWIICKSKKQVYGPLQKEEFDKLCKKLDVKNSSSQRHIKLFICYL